MSKRPPPDEKSKKKRKIDDYDIGVIEKNIHDVFFMYSEPLTDSLKLLKYLITSHASEDDIKKEYIKQYTYIHYLLESKRIENSKKYQGILGAYIDDNNYFNNLNFEQQHNLLTKIESIKRNDSKKPYLVQILESTMPDKFKLLCLNKLNQLKCDHNQKLIHWVESFLKLPFQKTTYLPVTIEDGLPKCQEYIRNCEKILNDCVYGMNDAKKQLMQLVGKWITNPHSIGTTIGLKGPMGVGKTTLVKRGISKLLNREFAFISLGGAMDGATLKGHSYTYEGGTYGRIADILIQSGTNNPVILFDELDKVSQTDKGQEIIGVLTHLTDSTQNNEFHDDYFSEIHLDLSKALIVCSYNDESLINPILKDRMYTIDIPGYSSADKICIAKQHLIPEIEKDLGVKPNSFIIQESVLKYLIDRTKKEDGVRNLKRNLETIYSKLNLFSILKETTIFNDMIEVVFPFEINESIINSLIKIQIQKHNPMYI